MIVLDTSAILALMWGEPGHDAVDSVLTGDAGGMSAVNWAEVTTKLHDRNFTPAAIDAVLANLSVTIWDLTPDLARRAGDLRPLTRHLGLSLGDRACLALAQHLNVPVLTADRAWSGLDIGLDIRVIR